MPRLNFGTNLGPNPTITWSGGTGPYTVTANGQTYCSSGVGVGSCSGNSLTTPGNYVIRVEDTRTVTLVLARQLQLASYS